MTTLQVGVKILLKNKHNKYLLIKRNTDKYKNIIGSWDIVGGRINPDTKLLENLKREIKEEIGLDFNDTPTLIAAQDIFTSEDKHIVRLTYKGQIEGKPILDKSENIEYSWFTKKEIENHTDLDIYLKELLNEGKI